MSDNEPRSVYEMSVEDKKFNDALVDGIVYYYGVDRETAKAMSWATWNWVLFLADTTAVKYPDPKTAFEKLREAANGKFDGIKDVSEYCRLLRCGDLP